MNTFGERLRLTTFGESHGKAIGGVIDGYPSGVRIDYDLLAARMSERRPGRPGTSPRKESDMPEFLSGLSPAGITLGTPIGFVIPNNDVRSADYGTLATSFRPNHADFTYYSKYGIRDHRGGGRASARETACRVVAGTLAEQFLAERGIAIEVALESVGGVRGDMETLMAEVEKARSLKDSVGGVVSCSVTGVPPGIGQPIYDKLSARLAYAMMGINAAKGFSIGDGFELASRRGSEVIDEFYRDPNGRILTRTNHSGGIQGGISNGMPVDFVVAFKPTPTIGKPLPLITEEGEEFSQEISGRHDPCVAVRAVPVVRAMAALVFADFILQEGSFQLK